MSVEYPRKLRTSQSDKRLRVRYKASVRSADSDYRKNGEGWDAGYQSVPVNWGISSARKRGFFELLSGITGANLSQSSPKGTL
ncbi:MAG: hypothetical protein DME21_06060 [Verrucomicrobia bacterium]|nr:MAG: hypothetical protein DME21_06060 [Verrucomicrobiota bacterium]